MPQPPATELQQPPPTYSMGAEEAMRPTDVPQKLSQGSLRLPIDLLKLVQQELRSQLSGTQAVYENEVVMMCAITAELQQLSVSIRAGSCLTKVSASDVKDNSAGNGEQSTLCVSAGESIEATTDNVPTSPEQVVSQVTPQRQVSTKTPESREVPPQSFRASDFDLTLAQGSGQVPEHLQMYVRVFDDIDVDQGGSVSADEIRTALDAVGIPAARIGKILSMVDKNGDGEIDKQEWMKAIVNPVLGEELRNFEQKFTAFKSSTSLKAEKAAPPPMCHTKIQPDSSMRTAWDMLVFALCLYIAVMLPFVLAFTPSLTSDAVDMFGMVDRVINYFFLVDVVFNFRTGYFNADGDVVMDDLKMMKHYLKGWFLLDLLSSMPFDELSNGAMFDLQVAKLLKLGKLVRIVKLVKPRKFDLADISVTIEDFMYSKPMQEFSRRGAVFFQIFIVSHWLACGVKFVDKGWLAAYQDVTASVEREYLAAVYWSMTTLTTVGYGDFIPTSDVERIYATLSMVLGGAFYGYIVGCITAAVASGDLNSSAYYDRMDLIHAWLAHHKLPMENKRSVRRYFKAFLTEKSAVPESEIWHDLSPMLQKTVGEYILHDNVKYNPLFDGLPLSTVVRLQSVLRRVTFPVDSCVTYVGEPGTAMYILISGVVSMAEDGRPLRNMKCGESYGEEIVLGLRETYTYQVVVKEKARFDMLLEEEFSGVFSSMPYVLDRMTRNFISVRPEMEEGYVAPEISVDVPHPEEKHHDLSEHKKKARKSRHSAKAGGP